AGSLSVDNVIAKKLANKSLPQ
ncbi:MAG TPA: DoxD-like family protein, partial [Pseudoalteromonas sp.]|nr:DoxD-like family protein [Pseudoalteromonas sp.]